MNQYHLGQESLILNPPVANNEQASNVYIAIIQELIPPWKQRGFRFNPWTWGETRQNLVDSPRV